MVKCKEQYYGGRNYLSFWCIEKFFIFVLRKEVKMAKYIYIYIKVEGQSCKLTL